MCDSCQTPKRQVFLGGPILRGLTEENVMGILTKCSLEKPIHVLKARANQKYVQCQY
jgi:hypothetical protein